MTVPFVLTFSTHDELYGLATAYVQRLARQAVAARGAFFVALAGGSTPRPLYRRLVDLDALPWPETHVFWGDERTVPPDHPESNYHQARELLLDHVPVPAAQVYRIQGELDPVSAAEAYAQTLLAAAAAGEAWPRFDLVLLGLGSDGHTASLFPGSTYPVEEMQPTVAVSADYGNRPAGRVSLTPPVFNSARHIFFLVTGAEKAEALKATLNEAADPVRWPACRIAPDDGQVIWFVDEAAAGQLEIEPLTTEIEQ